MTGNEAHTAPAINWAVLAVEFDDLKKASPNGKVRMESDEVKISG